MKKMKPLITILFIMTGISGTWAQDGNATTVKTTFHRETSVQIDIHASPDIIWALLTNAPDYPRWNSTIISIEGNIKPGEKIKLKSKLDPKRTFKLKIKEFAPARRLVWGDGQGKRLFVLSSDGSGRVTFSMTEKIGGFMFPMYAKYIPPFDKSFEQFAADLKKEAEAIQNLKK